MADEATALKIAHGGFNRSFCGKNATRLGCGVYFAANAGYSVKYASLDARGVQRMFVCRVLVGACALGAKDIPAPPDRADRQHQRFDSTVDDMRQPKIYVTYHDSQALPEYVISF